MPPPRARARRRAGSLLENAETRARARAPPAEPLAAAPRNSAEVESAMSTRRPGCARDRPNDRRPPASAGRQVEHHRELRLGAVGALAVRLVTTNTSPISRIPALIAWISSPDPGTGRRRPSRPLHDVHSPCPIPRSDHDDVEPAASERPRRPSGARKPAERAPRRHGANEHDGVRVDLTTSGCGRPGSRRR